MRAPSIEMMRLLLLDTSSMMYRAFFALPASITDDRGQPVNALHGYLDMTARLIAAREPEEVVHVYDADWRPAPRVALYAGYKANRAVDPEGLPEQFELLREILEAFGMKQAEAAGWEAEDAIAALCARAPKDDRIDIVTGDRDLIQLVRDPAVRVLFTRKGVSEMDILDEAAVLAKFGVPAARYMDFAILRGDPSDGLPGLHGVGEKTARALVQAYPSLDALIDDARSERRRGAPLRRSAKLRSVVREAAGYLEIMRQLVPVRSDAPVRTWRAERNDDRLDTLGERHKLSGPIRRLRQSIEGLDSARRSPELSSEPGGRAGEPGRVRPGAPPAPKGTRRSRNAG
jgi:5'-3' exonuclease